MRTPLPESACRAANPGRPAFPPPPPAVTGLALAILLGLPHLAWGEGLADCRAMPDDQLRLACYDRLAIPQTRAHTTPEALFGVEAQQSAVLLQQSLGEEPIDELVQVVGALAKNRYGKLSISLANGQRWEQTDTDRLPVKVGDTIIIRRAALGSYLLSRQAGGRSIRVRRAEAAAD